MPGVVDIIHHDLGPQHRGVERYTIVLIPGNPGLISYYGPFLQKLTAAIESSQCGTDGKLNFEVWGRSLFGFETSSSFSDGAAANDPASMHYGPLPPLGLLEQTDSVQAFLLSLVSEQQHGEPQKRLILIGHSVGAYILLEILHRVRLGKYGTSNMPDVAGAICLFPTVVDIADSPSGKHLAWLLKLSRIPLLGFWVSRAIGYVLGHTGLTKLAYAVTSFPEHALNATVAFLKNPKVVSQALHMAGDEMRLITKDKWGQEIWGRPHGPSSNLYFYFGEDDHWVAKETRDNLIASRARTSIGNDNWKPVMEIDDANVPHGFCIRDNQAIADKCCSYILQIVQKE